MFSQTLLHLASEQIGEGWCASPKGCGPVPVESVPVAPEPSAPNPIETMASNAIGSFLMDMGGKIITLMLILIAISFIVKLVKKYAKITQERAAEYVREQENNARKQAEQLKRKASTDLRQKKARIDEERKKLESTYVDKYSDNSHLAKDYISDSLSKENNVTEMPLYILQDAMEVKDNITPTYNVEGDSSVAITSNAFDAYTSDFSSYLSPSTTETPEASISDSLGEAPKHKPQSDSPFAQYL